MINIIVAKSKNNIIGLNNQLPWHIQADLIRFRTLTINKIVVMGRKTHESIGRALPNRRNIVLSNSDYKSDNIEVLTLDQVLEIKDEIFIIGGQQIYELFLPYAEKLFVTDIDVIIDGDTSFPEIDKKEWLLVETIYNNGDNFNYEFNNYIREF